MVIFSSGSSDDVLGTAGVKMVTMLLQIDNGTVQQFTAVYQTADKGRNSSCTALFPAI